jgi:GTPase
MSDAWKVGSDGSKKARIDESCILVALILQDDIEAQVFEHLDELDFLARTAGATTICREW